MNFLLKFLPADKRALIRLGQHIVGNLDTARERQVAAEVLMVTLSDGKVTQQEWMSLGKTIGVFGKKTGNK